MACITDCCVLSRGEFFIADWASDCVGGLAEILCESTTSGFRKVGNVSTAAVSISSQSMGTQNKFIKQAEDCARVAIEGVSIDITLECASAKNLYLALFGEKKEDDSGTHTKDFCVDEDLSGCNFFPFDKVGAVDTDLQVLLISANGDLVATLEIDVDFTFSQSGIQILEDYPILNGTSLRLIYTYDTTGFNEIDFLSRSIGPKALYFKGSNFNNDARNQFDFEFYKVVFTPISQFDLISRDSFFSISLSGRVEKDYSRDSWFRLIKQET